MGYHKTNFLVSCFEHHASLIVGCHKTKCKIEQHIGENTETFAVLKKFYYLDCFHRGNRLCI